MTTKTSPRLTQAQRKAVNRRVHKSTGETLGPKPTQDRALDLLTRAGLTRDEARAFLDEHRHGS